MIRILVTEDKIAYSIDNFRSVKSMSVHDPRTVSYTYKLSLKERILGKIELAVSVPYPREETR